MSVLLGCSNELLTHGDGITSVGKGTRVGYGHYKLWPWEKYGVS